MPFNPETEEFYRDPATVIDSGPGADTVKQGFDDRTEIAINNLVSDINLLKADGMIGVGVPATETARGIMRIATAAEVASGVTGENGPAALTPELFAANIPKLDAANVPFDPAPSGLSATDTQMAIDEVVTKIPSIAFNIFKKSTAFSWAQFTDLSWVHNLGIPEYRLSSLRFRIDIQVVSPVDTWIAGDIIRGASGRTESGNVSYFHQVTPKEILANSLKIRMPQYFMTSGSYSGGGISTFTTATSKIILNIWY